MNDGSVTEVALDRAGGGVFVDFFFRGVISAGESVGLDVSCTGDNMDDAKLGGSSGTGGGGGGGSDGSGGETGGESLGRGGGGGGDRPGGGGGGGGCHEFLATKSLFASRSARIAA